MRRTRRNQRGIVAVIVALAILSLLAIAGLAIDTGHLVLNKSRLQSAVDAAALAGAKTLDTQHNAGLAETAARAVFQENVAHHSELARVLSGDKINVEFSATLFDPGTTPARFIRVRAENFSMSTSFARLIGFNELVTRASAVAGPSAPIESPCDLFPVAVCCAPGSSAPHCGYPPYPEPGNNVTVLKLASAAAGSTFGPGNYQLLRIGGGGAADLRRNLAAGVSCAKYGGMVEVDPQPGNVVGPVAQGTNTRFGQYTGSIGGANEYPPDLVTTSPVYPLQTADGITITNSNGVEITTIEQVGYSYVDYLADYTAGRFTRDDGRPRRRVVTIPIVDCSNPVTGAAGTLPVKGFGCFFLLQPVVQSGSEGWMFGQFVDECSASGNPGQGGGGPGPFTIVLHDDPGSTDS